MVAVITGPGLWEEYKESNDAGLRQQLILQYTPLARYVAGRTSVSMPSVLDSEDIVSDATIGLIDAVERFDPRRGIKFETYAVSRIRGSIIDAARRLGGYPRSTLRKMKRMQEAVAALEDRNGASPTDDEVAAYLGITVEQCAKDLVEIGLSVVSLESNGRDAEDEDALSLVDVIPDLSDPGPAVRAEKAELKGELARALSRLSERDRSLLAMYYRDELPLKQISHALGISESRVCQLHTRIILKLRESLADAGLAPIA